MNEYYDFDHDTRLSKTDSEKLNLMAFNLKDLLVRLLEKRKVAKRNMIVDVNKFLMPIIFRLVKMYSKFRKCLVKKYIPKKLTPKKSF